MAETRKCEHGLILGSSSLNGIMWSGGIGFCRCHLGNFGYIDSGFWSQEGSRTITNDTTLCKACDGKATVMLTGEGYLDTLKSGSEKWERYRWWTDDEGHIHEEIIPLDEDEHALI